MKPKLINTALLFMLVLSFSCGTYRGLQCPDYTGNAKLKEHERHTRKIRNASRQALSGQKTEEPENWTSEELSFPVATDEDSSLLSSSTTAGASDYADHEIYPLTASIENKAYKLESSPVVIQSGAEVREIDNKTVSETRKAKFKELKKDLEKFQASKPAKGMAIASMVLGIVGFFILGIPLGILAIVFGAISLSRYKADPGQPGKGMAIAGLILGIVDIIGAIIVIAAL